MHPEKSIEQGTQWILIYVKSLDQLSKGAMKPNINSSIAVTQGNFLSLGQNSKLIRYDDIASGAIFTVQVFQSTSLVFFGCVGF